MPGWLKAGLIGAVILVLLNLIGLIPPLGCVTLPLTWLTYIGVGILAASYLPPVRQLGQGTGHGGLAALIASVGGGIVAMIISMARAALGQTAQALAQLPPEILQQLSDSGIPLSLFAGVGGAAVIGGVCCSIGVLIAVVLGAIGGAIYAAVKPE